MKYADIAELITILEVEEAAFGWLISRNYPTFHVVSSWERFLFPTSGKVMSKLSLLIKSNFDISDWRRSNIWRSLYLSLTTSTGDCFFPSPSSATFQNLHIAFVAWLHEWRTRLYHFRMDYLLLQELRAQRHLLKSSSVLWATALRSRRPRWNPTKCRAFVRLLSRRGGHGWRAAPARGWNRPWKTANGFRPQYSLSDH